MDISSGQFFLECDREGRIVWMSEAARMRLGEWEQLLEGIVPAQRAEMRRFLDECAAGDKIQVACHTRWRKDVPVRFSCFVNSASRLVLNAEFRERAADRLGTTEAGLSSLEGRLLQHYFRLLRVQQSLDSRLDRRRHSGAAVLEQIEKERARLGRELHTGAGQAYAAIRFQLELIAKQAPDLPQQIREALAKIGQVAQDADTEVRAISRRLHPPQWQGLKLVDALRNLWDNAGIPDAFQGSLTLDGLEPEPPQSVRVAVYRIVQEGLANAIRHSGATRLALIVGRQDGWLLLRLEDNGHGFDTREAGGNGIGLRSIQYHVGALGGAIQIHSGPEGTTLEIRIPIEPGDE